MIARSEARRRRPGPCGHLLPLAALAAAFAWAPRAAGATAVLVARDATPLETLAAREVARYLYLRTGEIAEARPASTPPAGECVVVARKGRPLLRRLLGAPGLREAVEALGPEEFVLRTVTERRRSRAVVIVGGDDTGTLYGAYRFAERLGVRFYLHGDVVPDARLAPGRPELNDLDERSSPLFATRGINPFHDFPEGPDWWDEGDHLAYVEQLAKMRMNFIGFHCYPEGGVGPEPGVWIGPPGDAGEGGSVASAYPSQWANTARNGMWGYSAMRTSEFCGGAAALFERDDFGPAVMEGMTPRPRTPEDEVRLFERVGAMYARAFARARALGVKTCLGTETPLTVPGKVRERVKRAGREVSSREIYEGIFKRIMAAHKLDYYWLWTPEGWTWGGNRPEQFQATVADIRSALEALDALGKPFELATCGWVLGPQHDRSALDAVLPKTCPMSCINRQVGHAPVEAGFAKVEGRPKWAIPWLENDPNMVAPQPWVGRMRHDAADARRLGCTGLLGIHWRTKAMAQNVSALARAAWDMPWAPEGFAAPAARAPAGPVGGQVARFTAPVEGTDEDPVYQVVRYNVAGYNLDVPNGTYSVTLKLNEPHYGEAGKRVFGAKVQGREVFDSVDIFARVGKNRALDFKLEGVRVTDGRLAIEFPYRVEFPCVAGIVVDGTRDAANQIPAGPYSLKVNCGGEAWKDYQADPAPAGGAGRDRAMPVDDFYEDFARASFGPAAAGPVGKLLAGIDGTKLPEPSTWLDGPGGVKAERASREDVARRYAFVDELARLREMVKSPGDLERFDYWLETYRYMRAMAQAGASRGRLDAAVGSMKGEADPGKKRALAEAALAVRVELARDWERMMTCLVASTDTPGELGTIANLEQHSRKRRGFVEGHDAALRQALGGALPEETRLSAAYAGPARIIVPTVRSLVEPGEEMPLKVILLAPADAAGAEAPSGEVLWRPLGRGEFARVPLAHVARGVFRATLPAPPEGAWAIEYCVDARIAGGRVVWPAAAPGICQTLVVFEGARE